MSPNPAGPYVASGGDGAEGGSPGTSRSGTAPTWPHPVYVERREAAVAPEDRAGEAESLGARLRAHLGDATAPAVEAGRAITRLCAAPALLDEATAALAEEAERRQTDVIVGLDPGGFMLGPLVARKLGLPFVPAWKSPRGASGSGWMTVTYAAAGEGDDERAISVADELRDEIRGGARCYLVDGGLDSDATLEASFRLVREGGGVVVGVGVIADAREHAGGYMVDGHNLLVLKDLT